MIYDHQFILSSNYSIIYFASMIHILIILIFLSSLSCSQKCLNNDGNVVSWWVMLNTPNSIPTVRYLYFDSTYASANFSLWGIDPSDPVSALGRTLSQINSQNLSVLAWNDQKPNGSTSSVSAHSKSITAVQSSSNSGFFIDHSVPQYPAFNNNTINITINDSQKVYGQHVFCISLSGDIIQNIVSNLRTIKPYIYQSGFTSSSPYPNMYALGGSVYLVSSSNFQFYDFTSDSFNYKSIYKNGNTSKNCSIFEDGLNNYLNSSLFVESWGRPLDNAWCGIPAVNNVVTVGVNSVIKWTQTKDHSKWGITQNGSWNCFGDMNRMKSQWKRGGAFYCLQSELLHDALSNLITFDSC